MNKGVCWLHHQLRLRSRQPRRLHKKLGALSRAGVIDRVIIGDESDWSRLERKRPACFRLERKRPACFSFSYAFRRAVQAGMLALQSTRSVGWF